ncbi:HNH endonuclease signature motif containing protein [Aspergillus mulundensis]|uniref:HNH nuclease domain-containing protein n=1 Tax=Aspergillus mulundensis TaxID=1810919 RepID=A0A3D8S5B9_9EURO|nr:hypothetical protein DSM5745_05062 [Aspergillus mulundensis]RDW81505.1 hypothetical protein DSM5745_05062 [Aspergillus mulundensis]
MSCAVDPIEDDGPKSAYDEISDDERTTLVNKVADAIKDLPVDSGFWAFMWLAPVKKLRKWVEVFVNYSEVTQCDVVQSTKWTRALKYWTARLPMKDSVAVDAVPAEGELKKSKSTKRKAATAAPKDKGSPKAPRLDESVSNQLAPAVLAPALDSPVQPEHTRSSAAVNNCGKRDKEKCLVTGLADCVHKAHIYPSTISENSATREHELWWGRLAEFYPKEKIEAWETAISGPDSTEILPNLLCLCSHVHQMWDDGKIGFKFKQREPDGSAMTVEFHWLYKHEHGLRNLRTAPTNPIGLQRSNLGSRLHDCESSRILTSGDRLVWTTERPSGKDAWPLPSEDLLEMKWALNRLVALSGAADVPDEELDPDDPVGLAPPIAVETEADSVEERPDGRKYAYQPKAD